MEKVDLEALDAMHAAAKSVGFVIEGDDLDTAQCGHYLAALHNAYPAIAAELRALRERVASLYTGMRRVIVAAGGVAGDGVSDEFLLGAADEVSALREQIEMIREYNDALRKERDALRAEIAMLRGRKDKQ